MTRFDAADTAERRKLFAEAVLAHRNRGSQFLTIEVDPADVPGVDADDEDEPVAVPWIQFAEKTFNLDCDEAELDRLKDLLSEFPECRIDQIERPEEAEGTNVRITARSDANRLGQFADRALQVTYGLDDDYRAWVTQI
ncbi:hypothetical protein [Haloplanus aerogenes]|uniref:DUF7975 domain-containing protein n=1 Tax=Haloplanus aerogenes TaxID=660522 RepID=A0A3M0DU71_9EURY|nr:hypothetical protein [Haloplanus aerogenes]AZH24170.1 hypothetical protein DU502_01720 [Haloplanus aerogenes]RMB24210.1 hypothetical protein ATH50_1452 [Haloplanus aerogenes]